jgi:hypothetical protein
MRTGNDWHATEGATCPKLASSLLPRGSGQGPSRWPRPPVTEQPARWICRYLPMPDAPPSSLVKAFLSRLRPWGQNAIYPVFPDFESSLRNGATSLAALRLACSIGFGLRSMHESATAIDGLTYRLHRYTFCTQARRFSTASVSRGRWHALFRRRSSAGHAGSLATLSRHLLVISAPGCTPGHLPACGL